MATASPQGEAFGVALIELLPAETQMKAFPSRDKQSSGLFVDGRRPDEVESSITHLYSRRAHRSLKIK